MERDLLAGSDPRVFVTDPAQPEEGRTFVWSRTRWYERVEGEMGNVAFTPVADSEEELRGWLAEDIDQLEEFSELDDGYAQTVKEEFSEQAPLYPEAPELSDESPFQEEETDGPAR